MFGICHLSVIPVRKEPSDKSELVSQLLFGERVEILEKKDSWRKVRIDYDDYAGWIDNKQIIHVDDNEALTINSLSQFMTSDLVQITIWNTNQICPLVLGSSLPFYSDHKFKIGPVEFTFDGNLIESNGIQTERLLEHAYMYLNAPYLWGGRSPFGIDCSGFTQMVYKLCGLKLLRDAAMQAEQGTTVNMIEESKAGDLAFFDNADGKITHTGIILPGNYIIHSSGKVRIDRIDHQGIYNDDMKSYSHNLRIIKRFF